MHQFPERRRPLLTTRRDVKIKIRSAVLLARRAGDFTQPTDRSEDPLDSEKDPSCCFTRLRSAPLRLRVAGSQGNRSGSRNQPLSNFSSVVRTLGPSYFRSFDPRRCFYSFLDTCLIVSPFDQVERRRRTTTFWEVAEPIIRNNRAK